MCEILNIDVPAVLVLPHSTYNPWCNLSPAELLMGRRVRANIPVLNSQLKPEWKFLEEFCRKNQAFKDRQKRNYDRQHGVQTLPPISDDSGVWITSGDQPVTGRVVSPADTPWSYIVETPSGQVRWNRQHLNRMPTSQDQPDQTECPSRDPIMTRSRTGTTVNPPTRLWQSIPEGEMWNGHYSMTLSLLIVDTLAPTLALILTYHTCTRYFLLIITLCSAV